MKIKQSKNHKNRLLYIVTITMVLVTLVSGKTIYVDDDAAGANNGSSWENAYTYLQDALADAETADKPVEIRVAQGTYTPDKGANRFIGEILSTFNLINDVIISGGYAGAADPLAKDIELYKTILSGDLLGNDEPIADPCDLFPKTEQDSRFDNSYNVVTAINTDETAVLDGFTITGGIASDPYINYQPQRNGGGLSCYQSSPLISNCTFYLNAAREGGAMYCENSSPTLINCHFEKNAAIRDEFGYGGNGGGMLNINSSPVLTNCTFTGNYGYTGGGMYNLVNSQPILTNCKFIGNSAKSNAGGGMNNNSCSPVLTNCFFEGNMAINGGGLHNLSSSPILTGCTFIANQASSDGGGVANVDSEPNLTDCEFISNIAFGGGSAISNDSCMNLVITSCIFTGNSANLGGAMQNLYSDLSITGSSFSGNAAFDGGVMQNWFSYLTVTNSLFTGNATQHGCAIQNNVCTIIVTNCIICGNAMKIYDIEIPDSSQDNQGTSGETPDLPNLPDDDIIDYDPDTGYLECINCIIRDEVDYIFNNNGEFITVKYSNLPGGFDGEGNIDTEPLFINPGYWADENDPNIIVEPNDPNSVWINGDYHLKSKAGRYYPNSGSWIIDDVTSSCIDAGDPNSLIEDEPQPNGGRINMGAYGGTSQASKSSSDDSKNL